ncbi:GntR family transcriptional regulator [Mycobacteroides abscessus]|uniref:GntR family transcriptional regulator n=1 Tax=Mycobacteroides abscessus TaxID=36809 RepID=UPI0009A8C15B
MMRASHASRISGGLTDAAYQRIRAMLLYQELRPGERTSVGQLSAMTGLGRAPVKAAIDRLAGEGLLHVRGRSGTFIAKLDATSVAQMFEMRTLYEDAAAGLIAQRVTDQQINKVTALLAELGSSARPSNGSTDAMAARIEFIDKDVQFHRAIIAGANNPYLSEAYRSLNLHLLISHYLVLDSDTRAARRQHEHENITQALELRDSVALALALRRHAEAIRDEILSTINHREVTRNLQ